MNRKTGHSAEKTGHVNGTSLARARPYGDTPPMSQCPAGHISGTKQGSERDRTAALKGRPSRPTDTTKHAMTWLHIAAMNLIADHDEGKSVNPLKLEAARKLMAASSPNLTQKVQR